MGRLHKQCQGVRSTHPATSTDDANEPPLPPPRSHINRHNHVGAHQLDLETDLQGMILSNLTGQFPFTSSRGITYLYVLYDYDSNGILACPIKSRQAEDIITGYEFCYQQLADAGVIPIIQHLNNEASHDLIKAITTKICNTNSHPPMTTP
jgi:hypothetical protein